MKSQIYVFILSLLLFAWDRAYSQPKISVDMGFGFYEPTLSGFDDNLSIQFPTKGFLNRNLLLNWGISYEFFNNARIGYNSLLSYEIGNNLEIVNSNAVFRRSIRYRMFPIETYFRWKPRIELNFTLTPIWGRGRIEMDTTPGDKTEDWNDLINSFGGDQDPITDMGATDVMISDWIGYGSKLGVRYYVNSRLAIDVKGGFMNNFYNNDNWRIQRQKVTGPKMKITDLPVFSLKIVYGIK
ncbi:MAG: hypothetical protein CMG60_08325 [Candidatus Marinimicrobia bacterium]|nr:hypothetical protein [Candidatus Neomarinimicrobiota bacterium]|tara:strand:+ start:5763 stop:6482 length:720 start_codon:yes stop_codon:yes gene_type:complete